MKKTIQILLYIFIIGLLTSTAAMSSAIYLLTLVVIGYWAFNAIKSKNKCESFWPKVGPDKYLWLYWAVITMGAVAIPDIPTHKIRWEVFTEGKWIAYLYALTFSFIFLKGCDRKFINTLAVVAVPVSLYSIFQCFTGIDFVRTPNPNYILTGTDLWRTRGFFSTPLTLAYSFALLFAGLVPFVLYKAIDLKKTFGRLFLVSIILIAATIVCTFVRGAWIALVAQAALIFYLWDPKKAFKPMIASLIIGLIVTVSVPSIRHRVTSIADFQSHSTAVRFKLWQSNWEMFKEHPLLGIGARRNSEIVETYNMKLFGEPVMATNAHNNIMQVLAGVGIFGFIFWVMSMAGLFWVTFKNFKLSTRPWDKSLHLGSLAAQFGFHVGGLTQATFVDSEVLLMYCFWVALSIATRGRELTDRSLQV